MKKNFFRLIAGMLSAVMLFTNEGMSSLAYAAPADVFSETGSELVEGQNPENQDGIETEITEEENSNDTDPETEQPKVEDPGDTETEQPRDENPDDTEAEVPKGDNTDELPVESTPEISVSANSTEPFADNEDTPEMTDFSIVDEGGNILSETQTVYLVQGDTRKFSAKLDPEGAVADQVEWTVDDSQISVTNGVVSLVSNTTINSSVKGKVTCKVTAGEKTAEKTCNVEFLPQVTDFEIIDQEGNVLSEDDVITLVPGQQIKLGVNLLPEGTMSDKVRTTWRKVGRGNIYNAINITSSTGVITASTPKDFSGNPAEVTATVSIPATTGSKRLSKSIQVNIVKPSENVGTRYGDILFSSTALGESRKINDTTWEADIYTSQKSKIYFTLSNKGSASDAVIYYTNSSREITLVEGTRPMNATRVTTGKNIPLNPKYPLKMVLATGGSGTITSSDVVYTIRFKPYSTDFSITPTKIQTIPGDADRELQIEELPEFPEGTTPSEVTWTTGDPRLVRIGNKTENGVMLQFGQASGKTQITAMIKDHRGETHYAYCLVEMGMKLPSPDFSCETGSVMTEKKIDSDGDSYINDYWLIDKGSKVILSLKSLPQAEIYYTTNGADPLTNGTLYRSPITVNTKTTIKACAKLEGYSDSSVSDAEFRIGTSKLSLPASVTVAQDSTKNISVTLPTGASPGDVTWYSSDDDVATADTYDKNAESEDENVTPSYIHCITPGSTAGKCTITASVIDYAGRTLTADCQVTVTGKLELTPAEITLKEGESTDIKFKTLPQNVEIEWSEEPDRIITLTPDASGAKITANQLADTSAPQTVTVTASMTVEMDVTQEDGTTEKEERTYSARCQVTVVPQSFEVTFLGWNDTVAKTETVNRGQAATPPTEEEMNAAAPKGYAFAGWADGNAWINIQEDTIVKAKPYTVTSYTITYETGTEGSNSSDNPVSYTVTDPTIVLKDAIPGIDSEKSFAGWYLNSDYSDSPVTEIPKGSTGDITLYAKWSSAGKGLRIDAIAAQYYTGKAIQPKVQVYDGDTLLTQGTDYTIKYKNNTKAADTSDSKKAPTVTVTGKGNYKGADTATFVIIPQSISQEEASIVIPDMCLSYNKGKKLNVVPTVTWNGKKLKNNTEFKVTKIINIENDLEVTECKEAGDYTVTVSGVGNFSGTRNISLSVTDKKLLSKVKFKGKLTDTSWDTLQGQTLGEKNIAVDAGITLTDGQYTLQKGTDYTVTYNTDIKDVGTYEAIFTGIGDKYAGTVIKTFKITGKPINASKLKIENLVNLTYDGTEQTFGGANGVAALKISYKNGKNFDLMQPGNDYELSYVNTTNAGNKATVVITGINGYTGIVKKTFKITPYSMQDDLGQKITISLEHGNTSVPYEKGGAKPKAIVKYGDTTLTEGADYTVKYKNNTKVADKDSLDPQKAPSLTVTGKGNFKGAAEPLTFSISAQDIGMTTITAEDVMAAAPNTNKGETIGKTGAGKYKSTPKLTDRNGKALSAGTDYLKTYTYTNESGRVLGPKEQVAQGSILTVTVQGTKNYTGETKVSYRVLAAKMSVAQASVSIKNEAKAAIKYDLEPVTLKKEDLVVKIGKQELTADDYTILSYVNNRKKGTAKVTIQGVGEYGGRKTISFLINPRIFTFMKP